MKGKQRHLDKKELLERIPVEKQPVCFFTIAYGAPHIKEYAVKMANSLKKFHPDIPHFILSDEAVKPVLDAHPDNKWRLYATMGANLSKRFELVINIDNDSIVCGKLDHIINDNTYDVAVVQNNNLIDPKLTVWDVAPEYYVNAGFVAIRGERPWTWWMKLCGMSCFKKYKMVEQDMLNIMVHYGDLVVKPLDFSDKWHGLIHKGQWHKFVLRDDKIILPKEDGVCSEDKEIKVIHFAGGNVPKMNPWVYFQEPVAKRLVELMEDKNV